MKQRKVWMPAAALALAALIAGNVLFRVLPMSASAVSSSVLKGQLDDLQSQADEIAAKAADLQQQIADNQSETQSFVDQKANLDQQIELTRQQVENLTAQIQQYNLLIAAKQEELDEAEAREAELNEMYKLRLRAMEETGSVSYWEVLFNASSFTDLLDRIDMIAEISKADRTMLEELRAAAAAVADAKTEIQESRSEMEAAKTELDEQEALLSDQRAEADAMIVTLLNQKDVLLAAAEENDAMEAEIRQQILDAQIAYEDALADEKAQQAIEDAREQASSGSISKPSSTSSSGFLYPLGASGSITDAYGYRYHPIYGYYKFHPAVDFAVPAGTPIYATKSGTVTAAEYNKYNGYYVAINHNDGYTSLYAHMTNYIVSPGQTVSQGEVIGYVGTTGVSTGPHMHFEITYGGASVNPMEYVSIP